MNYSFFVNPFAASGDKTAVPVEAQINGTVSYEQGYPSDYSGNYPSDPNSKPFPRLQHNQVLFDVTKALRQYQSLGIPEFITAADNLGAAFSYSKFALALYDDGVRGIQIYQSLVDSNTSLPTDTTKWRWVNNGVNNLVIDNTTFTTGGSAVINNDIVYYDASNSRFDKAIANNTVAELAVGIADVSYKRVLLSGLVSGFSGLTPGAEYYLSSSSAGAITSTPPTNGRVYKIGVALSATILLVNIEKIYVPGQQEFTSSGSFTVPYGITGIYVSGTAGGGGGGGGAGAPANTSCAGGGGGGGGTGEFILRKKITVTPGQIYDVTIGSAGTGGSGAAAGLNAGSDGTAGTDTILELSGGAAVLTLVGGSLGAGAAVPTPSAGFSYPGRGGAKGGITGGVGHNNSGNLMCGNGGTGGANPFGIPGGPSAQAGTGNGDSGIAATGYGAGGSGGSGGGSATGFGAATGGNGANGAPGYLRIEW
jgi:hypothetical protein